MSLEIMNVVDHAPTSNGFTSNNSRSCAKPLFTGGGHDYLVCGDCCYPIAMNVSRSSFRVRFIACPECGAVNDRG